MKKTRVWSIVFFSLVGATLLAMAIHIPVLYFMLCDTTAHYLPSYVAFLLFIPYGVAAVIFLIVALILLSKSKNK